MKGDCWVEKSNLPATENKVISAVDLSGRHNPAIDNLKEIQQVACDRRRQFPDLFSFVLIGVFVILIFAPLIKMMTSERQYFSSAEKRRLSDPPAINFDWQI